MRRLLPFVNSLIFISLLSGCTSNFKKNDLIYSDSDVIGMPYQKADQINIDVYVDATTSMEGFAVNNSSKYSQFLDQIEAVSQSAWKKADIKFFKFGKTIKPIDRTQFLQAKNELSFYRERGVFETTYIDSVIKSTDSKRLSVVITDLFQSEGDVNNMVNKIKEKCFANNMVVGILGIKTDFKGTIYDVPGLPPYSLQSTERPFYAIAFGNNSNLEFLFDALKTQPFINDDQVLLFTRNIVQSFKVSVIKNKDSKFGNKKTVSADIHNLFDFSMNEKAKEARFDFELNLTSRKRTADFSEKAIEIFAFKKSSTDSKSVSKDSVPSSDLSLENIKRTGGKITGTLVLSNSDPIGNYSYIVYLKLNELSGMVTPKWIKDFSTDAPVPKTATESKTLNLDKLSSTLLVANASIAPTYIAKFYLNIFKR